MSAVVQTAPVANLVSLGEIQLTVFDNMRLLIYPQEIARAGEHNSAVFRIVSQPARLDGLPCRAEIKTADGSTFHILVTDGTFRLTNDITKHGVGTIQLVYADGTVSHKTQQAQYWVAPSVNAVTESDPEYQDGLAQLSNAAFADAATVGTVLAFVNIYGREVARVTFPGAGLDEETASQLFLRLNGTNQMDGSLLFARTNLGVVFDPNGISATIYCDTGLRLRRGNGNGEITIEDANGTQASRSPVMTQATSDARYPTIAYVNTNFIPQTGGLITGPIRQLGGAPPAFDETLVTRDYVQAYVYSLGYLSQGQADQRYLQLAGGQLNGILSMAAGNPIISAMGLGNQPMLCIGSNDSGFWRTGGTVVFEVGRAATWLYSALNTITYMPLTLAGAPTQAGHAANKQYVDEQRAPSLKFDIPVDFPLSSTWQNLYTQVFPIPRGGISRLRVTVSASCRAVTQGGLAIVGISCQPEVAIDRIERQAFVYNLNGPANGFTVEFFVDVNGTAPTLTLQATTLATNPGTNDITILGGDTFNIQRSQILIEDLGAR